MPKTKNVVLRGELVIKEKVFQEKYGTKFSNSRNFVAGLINRKTLSAVEQEMMKDIDFVSYELIRFKLEKEKIGHSDSSIKISEQFEKIKKLCKIHDDSQDDSQDDANSQDYSHDDANTQDDNDTNCKLVKNMVNIDFDKLTNEFLSEKLVQFRNSYEYNIDGIICCDDKSYARQNKNPDHAFAFKMVLSDQEVEAKVLDVLWTVSKDGLLKPRVQFEPVTIGGVVINYATGFNAKFIKDNNIGLGAIVRLIRSGDVIPYIKEVIVSANTPIMPIEEYVWNSTNVDIVAVNKETNVDVKIKNIAKFFKDLNVEGLGPAYIEKIVKTYNPAKNIYYDSVSKILSMSVDDLKLVENFKDKILRISKNY